MKPVLSMRGRPFIRLSRTILPADLGIGATAASLSVVGGGRVSTLLTRDAVLKLRQSSP